jgi:hypothetical protein
LLFLPLSVGLVGKKLVCGIQVGQIVFQTLHLQSGVVAGLLQGFNVVLLFTQTVFDKLQLVLVTLAFFI